LELKRRTLVINLDKIEKQGIFCGESLFEPINIQFFDDLQKCFSLNIRFINLNFREYDYILLLTIASFPELRKKELKEKSEHLFLEASIKECLKCGYRVTNATKKKICPKCKSTLYPYVLRKNEFLSEEKMRKIIEATTTVDEIIIIGGKPKLKVLKYLLEVIPEYFNIKIMLLDPSKLELIVDVK